MPNTPPSERRSADRPPDDAGWESKVLARLSSRLQARAASSAEHDEPALGWESSVLDVLRRRIETESK